MAYSVEFRTPELDVPKVDVLFRVKRDGRALGKLRISKGGIEWMQRGKSKRAYHMSWGRMDEIFVAKGAQG